MKETEFGSLEMKRVKSAYNYVDKPVTSLINETQRQQ